MKLSIFISELSKILPRGDSNTFINDCKSVKLEQRKFFLILAKTQLTEFDEVFRVIQIIEQITINTPYYYEDFINEYMYINYLFEFIRHPNLIENLVMPDFNKRPIYYQDSNGHLLRTS